MSLKYKCPECGTPLGFEGLCWHWEYRECRKKMKYLAQIHWDTIMDCAEGTLYVEICPECRIITMFHQQT